MSYLERSLKGGSYHSAEMQSVCCGVPAEWAGNTKIENTSMTDYLSVAGLRIVGSIPFPMVLTL